MGERFAILGLMLLSTMSWQVFAADAAESAEPIRLPLTIIGSNPVTTITVGERTVQAIVDTGGGALMLSKEVLDSAGAIRVDDTVVSTDATGRDHAHSRFRVPVVTIGGQTFRDMPALEMAEGTGPPIPNILGRHFMSRYFVVVDYAGRAITLWPPDTANAAGANCGRTRIPMQHTMEDGLAVGTFETASGRLRLLFDTGATYSAVPEKIAEKRQLATIARGQTKFWQSAVLSAAGHDFGPLEFVLQPLRLPPDFEGMLGANFFAHHIVCFDYARREIRVRRPIAGDQAATP